MLSLERNSASLFLHGIMNPNNALFYQNGAYDMSTYGTIFGVTIARNILIITNLIKETFVFKGHLSMSC